MTVGFLRCFFFFFQAEDGIRDLTVTGVQTCALPISLGANSVAMERTRFLRPARAAEVATMCGSGCEASSELTQTMAGCAVRSSCGKKARVGCSTEKNFRCSSSVQAASSVLANVEIGRAHV